VTDGDNDPSSLSHHDHDHDGHEGEDDDRTENPAFGPVSPDVRASVSKAMPPRSTPPTMIPKGSFHPPHDTATYRDLLMFEERLKSNASSLKRRKRRYQCACTTSARIR
jgi:hypothetical protein